MADFSKQTMEEYQLFAGENQQYLDEETGKTIFLSFFIGGIEFRVPYFLFIDNY